MGRLEKLKRGLILESNKRILNEQGIDPQEYPLHMDRQEPQDNTRVDMPPPPNFKVNKPLPECSKELAHQTEEIKKHEKQGKRDFRLGPVTHDFENVRLQVVLPGAVQPGYEGIYAYKDGKPDAFCKFDFKR